SRRGPRSHAGSTAPGSADYDSWRSSPADRRRRRDPESRLRDSLRAISHGPGPLGRFLLAESLLFLLRLVAFLLWLSAVLGKHQTGRTGHEHQRERGVEEERESSRFHKPPQASGQFTPRDGGAQG